MIKLAIIEDLPEEAKHISSLVERYSASTGVPIQQTHFASALKFLDAKEKFDILLLDIMMPGYNGMEMAHRLRKIDEDTEIAFITSMKQYAIEGYSVNARGFLLKPAKYEALADVLDRMIALVQKKSSEPIAIRTRTELISVEASSIEYVEVKGHFLLIHTQNQEIQTKGTLKEFIEKVDQAQFIRCNNYAVVNAKAIRAVREDTVVLSTATLEISRRRKADFIEAYLRYSGGLYNA